MLARKVSKYSWRACQPYEACYNYNRTIVKKQFSFWKVAISVIAAFFVVIFVAKVLSGVGSKVEGPTDQKTATIEETTKVSWVNKILGIKIAQAADYSAQKMRSSCDQLTMAVGETKVCTFGFLNTGSVSWSNSASSFASVYTAKPNYRSSLFTDNSWYRKNQPAKIKGSAGPGQLGLFTVTIKAPSQTGSFSESFRIALEDTAWIAGGEFTIQINVLPNTATNNLVSQEVVIQEAETDDVGVEEPIETNVSTNTTTYNSAASSGTETNGAFKMLQSATSLEFKNTSKQLVRVGFKNTSLSTWRNYGNNPMALVPRDMTTQSFANATWLTDKQIVFMKDKEVSKGQIGYFEFYLSPHSAAGDYTANFQLKTGNRIIPGSEFSLPITVHPAAVTVNRRTSASPSSGSTVVLAQAPTIRVGLTKVQVPVWLESNYQYEIWSGEKKLLATMPASEPVTVDFQNGQYIVTTDKNSFISQEVIKLISQNGDNGIWTIKNYENRPSWNQTLNDNRFRGTMEVNGPDSTGRVWVINVLNIEDYSKGSGEVSNNSDMPALEAMSIVYRSYANYYRLKGGGRFDVYDTSASQVYYGYGAELRLPRLVQAVNVTRGQIVTYNSEPVVTPYFSRSDGHTRTYTEVWGGEHKPWLVSVSTPHDVGKTLWGHGVGMSCREALYMAETMTAEEIIKYFYTGTSIRKDW